MANLKHLADLAALQLELEAEVANLEASLQEAKQRLAAIQEGQLPQLMEDAGVSTYILADGQKVSVDKKLHPTVKDKDAMWAWMRAKGYGALIKNSISIAFGKGEDAEAIKALDALASLFPKNPVKQEQGVHPSTLKAWVNEMLQEGKALPDCLDIFERRVATIKAPKVAKKASAVEAMKELRAGPHAVAEAEY